MADFHLTSREYHPENTIIEVGGAAIGDGGLALIAGPCSIESEDQIVRIAKAVKAAGATMLRGGAFKPRTSPYTFQGLEAEGLEYLIKAGREAGLPTVSEITDETQLDLFRDIDIIQVGAKNMQNFGLLHALGKVPQPILLKRGFGCTYEEVLSSAEHIMAAGNERVILCERGIRTFETYTRFTFDVSSIPSLKTLTHLPVIADPSHPAGRYELIEPLSLAAVAAGADGLIIEVHDRPDEALCDAEQALKPDKFESIVEKAQKVKAAVK
ncbi:MAG: 3-deoxy-7-phosphoheptulonate synthase [Clostridia bacterium]|nr:3-deoxy-7-phosphoheptulonate synthase [Clostridia bacterium]